MLLLEAMSDSRFSFGAVSHWVAKFRHAELWQLFGGGIDLRKRVAGGQGEKE